MAKPEFIAREREVLQLIAQGKKASEIGQALNIAGPTVGTLVDRLKAKLNVKTYEQLAAWWQQNG